MDTTPQFWKNVGDHLFAGAEASPPSFATLVFPLVGDAEIISSYLARTAREDHTVRWRGVWLTDHGIAYAQADYPLQAEDDEDRFSSSWGASGVIAWLRDYSDLTGVDVSAATGGRRVTPEGYVRAVFTDYVFKFRDGTSLNVPLPGANPTAREREAIDRLATEIVKRRYAKDAAK
ncbi:hypothetical protein [Rhodococcus coprophilus]|uniref:hypothetical protein n=1 Tax=Rhodococcus coprophilus TaxID=38310 RepID=UPI0033E05D41